MCLLSVHLQCTVYNLQCTGLKCTSTLYVCLLSVHLQCTCLLSVHLQCTGLSVHLYSVHVHLYSDLQCTGPSTVYSYIVHVCR